jgi:hypothetical protein
MEYIPIRSKVIFLCLATILLFSCSETKIKVGQVAVQTADTPVVYKRPSVQVITSKFDLVDFGWLPDGRIYYGMGGDPTIDSAEPVTDIDETAWYAYNIEKKETAQIERPYPGLSSTQMDGLEPESSVHVLTMTISPSTKKVLFTRLPTDYERPQPLLGEYFDPAEIWVNQDLSADDERVTGYPLMNGEEQLYSCGLAMSVESKWFDDETIVLGSCYFPYGVIRVYFLADLLNDKVQFLDFETSDGEYVPSEHIAVANNSPSLAFYTEGGLWMVPVEDGEREISLTLTGLNHLFDDRPAMSPTWSLDDEWIYYWTSGAPAKFDSNGSVEYQPWWLEKINVHTRERRVLLSEHDLLSLMSYDMYRRGVPYGYGNPWKLSPAEDQILMFLNETVDTPATLFLISLPDK